MTSGALLDRNQLTRDLRVAEEKEGTQQRMDKKLQIIERLYEEEAVSHDGEAEQHSEDAVDQREHTLLAEAKFVMDHRTRMRPDPGTIDRIVAEAGAALSYEDDRAPKRYARILPLHRWQTAVAAVFVLFMLGVAYWQLDSAVDQPTDALSSTGEDGGIDGADPAVPAGERADMDAGLRDAPAAQEEQESAALANDMSEPAAGRPLAESPRASLGPREGYLPAAATTGDSLSGWDNPADLLMLQRRIEMLAQSRSLLDWDEPVPLEQLPAAPLTPGLRAAGAGNANDN